MKILSSLALILPLIALVRPADAGKLADVTMPDTIEVAGKSLKLNGMGLREATIFKVDVYVAGLYLETVSSNATTIVTSKQTKRLVLRFVRDVDRSDILKAWNEGFKGNATVKLPAIQGLIDRLNAWMTDFDDGDTLTFTYVPDTGVEVRINNTVKGTLKSDDFASSLFSIWLGSKPPTKPLRTGLLGNHGARS